MLSLKKKLNEVGYSIILREILCHSSCKLRAKIIERHITISKKMNGPDHKSFRTKYPIKLKKH